MAAVILASLLSLGLLTGVGVALIYENWNDNLNYDNIDDLLSDRPDKVAEGPLNILVMGDDTRDGKGNRIDQEGGGGSDTTIMFHLSADRKFAYGISVPRDTVVDRPECKEADGSVIPAQDDAIWNAAYAVGGPACTQQQFEQLTGIRIDNYVVVNFNGFKDMVDALDGVEVCIPEDIVDEDAGITLRAGTREIEGNEALSYVRVRKGVAGGDGTDPQRIKRQQAFMASMINEALSADMLARPDQLVSFINATTKSLTTDFENIAQLAELAASFNGIGLDNISFVTTPWIFSTRQEGRVEWTADVEKLWRLARDDKRLTAEFRDDAINAAVDPEGSPAATDPASGTASGGPSDSPGDDTSEDPEDADGLSKRGRAAAGLC